MEPQSAPALAPSPHVRTRHATAPLRTHPCLFILRSTARGSQMSPSLCGPRRQGHTHTELGMLWQSPKRSWSPSQQTALTLWPLPSPCSILGGPRSGRCPQRPVLSAALGDAQPGQSPSAWLPHPPLSAGHASVPCRAGGKMLPVTTGKKYGCPSDGDGSLESKSIPERSPGDAGKELRQKEAPALTWGSGSSERSHVFTHGNYIFRTAINCSKLFSPTRPRGCSDTYGKGRIGPDPWGKQGDPQHQDLPAKHSTRKASDQQGVTWSKLSEACICPPHKIPHLLQSVRLFHARARPVTGISHRVHEGRRDPANTAPGSAVPEDAPADDGAIKAQQTQPRPETQQPHSPARLPPKQQTFPSLHT